MKILVFFAFTVLLFSISVLANVGQIRGNILLDYSVLPGVGSGTAPGTGVLILLEPISPTPGTPQQFLTTNTPSFEFLNLLPGQYKMTISKPQFKTQILQIQLNPGEIKIINVILEPEKVASLDSSTFGINYNPITDRVYIAYPSDTDAVGGIPHSAGPQDVPDMAAIPYGHNPLEYADRKYFSSYGQDAVMMYHAVNSISIMSSHTDGKIKAIAKVNARVHLISFHPSYKKLYALDYKSNFYVISPEQNNKVVNNFSLSNEGIPSDLAVNPNFVYVTLMGPNPKLIKLDANRDFPLSAIEFYKNPKTSKLGILQPNGIAISPDNEKIFVSYGDSTKGYLLTLNPSTLEVISTLKVGAHPIGVATPDGRRVYIANYNDNSVSLVDAKNNIEVGRFRTGYKPSKIVVHPSLKWVYVSNEGSNTISVIDVLTSKIVANIQTSEGPTYMGIDPNGLKMYVSCKVSKKVDVIDLSRNAVVATTVPGLFSTPAAIAVKK
ncbi:MAG: beta-propeller fold lactonase family protein [Candidatus Calescibacterium sp.]|nr:beta-propeller fold lactonase family protein [Candidatus Calescibacterium sp.]MCX7972231.1 beta-propeller fold lactonase family protein [bacterium]MDW8195168.1 beta-propeller fold lactonase family protein [Candidatus Calescibacterium sp.]